MILLHSNLLQFRGTWTGGIKQKSEVWHLNKSHLTSNEEKEMIKSMEMHNSINSCSSMLKFLIFVKIWVFGWKMRFFTISENEIRKTNQNFTERLFEG